MIGSQLIRWRRARGLTQSALARLALVTPANLCAIESGRRDCTVRTLVRLARVLNIEPAELLRPVPVRHISGRFALDAVARAALSGRNLPRPDLSRLAKGLAWRCRPFLEAAGAAGSRRTSRRAWNEARALWSPGVLDHLEARVRKLAAAGAGQGTPA